ncbi:MAG: hypothetical protein CSA25_06535 [Desulfobacter postgatei]|uniref:Uncharacterized protein n=1 Tax=Desulfobacter postgatei TaxID=2293 RepID=A0A2G6MPY2_9BACT|nr:MAG: hypothetical protein CSA25_06535 [Desulfobacter postgatei]
MIIKNFYLRPMIKIKSSIYLSFKPSSALRQQTHINNMRLLACLDGDLKSGVSVADLILIMGLSSHSLMPTRREIVNREHLA